MNIRLTVQIFFISLVAIGLAACSDNQTDTPKDVEMSPTTEKEKGLPNKMLKPPVAKKVAHEMVAHGDTRIDDYYWMRDDERKDPEILSHLEAENAYTESMLAHTKTMQDQLYKELVGRLEKNNDTVPYRLGNYWYYSRYEENNEYPIYARKKETLDAEESVTLNVNELAGDNEFFTISGLRYSNDENLLAYGEDTLSRRIYTIKIKDLSTGKLLSDQIESANSGTVWSYDSQYLFYIKKDLQTLLGNKVYRHKLGTKQSDDVLVYEEKDNTLYLSLSRSDDHKTIVLARANSDTASALYLDATKPENELKLFAPHEKFIEYQLLPMGDYFFVISNREAINYQIYKVHKNDIANLDKWQLIISHRDDVLIEDIETFDHFIATSEKVEGLNSLVIYDVNGMFLRKVSFDDAAYSMSLNTNPANDSNFVRISYSSMTTPGSIIDVDMNDGTKVVKKQDKVLGDYDASRYQSERFFVTARDGVKVPVSLVYRKDRFKKDGTNPLYQYGYGSYGVNMSPRFKTSVISLMDRGFVYALAHIRGSSTLGRQWYEDGKLLNKKNTFTDFIDVTKALIQQKYAAEDKIMAAGGSAGGLLIGAVANMAPELYLGLSAHVPWVDVVTTMSDASIPLTTNEYTEWGNPADKEYYDYMLSYSPYDQVKAQKYPNMFITTGLHDSQVQYFEPSKWVAKLREMKTDNNVLLYDVNMDAGHGGSSGRFRRYEILAKEYAFYFDLLGINE